MSDKPSLSDWKYPSNPNSPNPNANTGPPAPSATRPVEVAHGRSSSSAFSSNAGTRGAPASGAKRALSSINEASSPGTSPTAFGKDLRHRTNASVFAAQMGGSQREGASFPTSPQQAVKMVYSNVRRRSFTDLAYSVLFVGSLLLFAYSVTGVGWDPANAAKTALGRNAASAVKKAVQVKIPDSFLPNEAPPDVHQPHGDDSHDVGQDYLHDSPDDPKLDNDNAHRHIQNKDDALFASGHEDAEQELDKKLNREVTTEEQQAEAEAEPLIENTPEDDDQDDDDDDGDEAAAEGEAEADNDNDDNGDDNDDDDDDDDDEEEEEEEDKGDGPDALDAESEVLSSHDHHHASSLPDLDAPPAAQGDLDVAGDADADDDADLDPLAAETATGAEGSDGDEEEEDGDDGVQDGEAVVDEEVVDEDNEGLAALPVAARRKAGRKGRGGMRMLR